MVRLNKRAFRYMLVMLIGVLIVGVVSYAYSRHRVLLAESLVGSTTVTSTQNMPMKGSLGPTSHLYTLQMFYDGNGQVRVVVLIVRPMPEELFQDCRFVGRSYWCQTSSPPDSVVSGLWIDEKKQHLPSGKPSAYLLTDSGLYEISAASAALNIMLTHGREWRSEDLVRFVEQYRRTPATTISKDSNEHH